MGKLLVLIAILILITVIWSFPLYICINLVLWLFNIPFHLTLFQSFGICLLVKVIHDMLFKKGDN